MSTLNKFHLRIAGCFIELDDKFLLLHRLPEKSEGNKWGIPAGKLEGGEKEDAAVLREVEEETGIILNPENLEKLPPIEWVFGSKIISFIPFRVHLNGDLPIVKINPNEHQAYAWVTADECYNHPELMHGVQDLLVHVGYSAK